MQHLNAHDLEGIKRQRTFGFTMQKLNIYFEIIYNLLVIVNITKV